MTVWDWISTENVIAVVLPLWEQWWVKIPATAVLLGLTLWGVWGAAKRYYVFGELPAAIGWAARIWDGRKSHPVSWDFSSILGWARYSGSEPFVTNFNVQGIHRRKRPVGLRDAFLQSPTSLEKIPMMLETRSNFKDTTNVETQIPAGARIRLECRFHDEGATPGLTHDRFFQAWGEIDFVVYIDGKEYRKRFSERQLRAMSQLCT